MASKKYFRTNEELMSHLDRTTGHLTVFARKAIVENVGGAVRAGKAGDLRADAARGGGRPRPRGQPADRRGPRRALRRTELPERLPRDPGRAARASSASLESRGHDPLHHARRDARLAAARVPGVRVPVRRVLRGQLDRPAAVQPGAAFPPVRPAGAVEGYRYSEALSALDLVWTEETIDALFDIGPDHYIAGMKMPMQQIARPEDRADLIDFLKRETALETIE